LRSTGECDDHTWRALVEATWKLGDRLLVLTSPNLRGDDVAELQAMLARLGFDCGRVDGIFGPLTARAVEQFQRDCGVHADGVAGTDTYRALRRVSGQTGSGPGIAHLREEERWHARPSSLAALRVVVGQSGGLSPLTRALARELRTAGAEVMPLDEPDAVVQASAANQFGATVYVGFEATNDSTTVVHFYKVPAFESVGGRTLAELVVTHFRDAGVATLDACGMRLPVLRETKMPAVLVSIGPVRAVLDGTPVVAGAVVTALRQWTVSTAAEAGDR
jgi:N-acetylmuramoyl-L-alanine amidase